MVLLGEVRPFFVVMAERPVPRVHAHVCTHACTRVCARAFVRVSVHTPVHVSAHVSIHKGAEIFTRRIIMIIYIIIIIIIYNSNIIRARNYLRVADNMAPVAYRFGSLPRALKYGL